MSEWQQKKLESYLDHQISLGRGEIISKDDIAAEPGPYPIYSSSAHNNGKFGEYGKFMFDEELVTWSVDGGGYFFYRPKHKFSVTNVCGFMRIRDEQLNAKFIFYCLSNQHKHLTFDYTTKAHPSVIKKLYSLPDVDYEQQKRIADILTSIDQAIEKTESLIEKYQLIKAGLMHDLFTRGITADGKLRPSRDQAPELYQETVIGWIPKEWRINTFGEHISVIDPNPSHRYPLEVDEGYPICSTENFSGEDGYTFKKTKLVPESVYRDQNNRCRFSETDVIFARKGKIGLARRYGIDKKVFSHTVVLIKPFTKMADASWLVWLSRSHWLLKAIDVTMNTNSGVPTLGVEFIKGITVPFPKTYEQKLIDQSLDSVSKKFKLKSEKSKLESQKSGLMHDLLTGKVPVTPDEKADHV